jgi:hypothetical protein
MKTEISNGTECLGLSISTIIIIIINSFFLYLYVINFYLTYVDVLIIINYSYFLLHDRLNISSFPNSIANSVILVVPVVGFLLEESLPTQLVILLLKHKSHDDGKDSLILPQSSKVGP